MILDNSDLIARFCPPTDDGDTFIYTEMLDRRKEGGNNNRRLVKTYYHHSQEEFWQQWPMMKDLADRAQVRLMTRLAPRSYEKVGKLHTKLVVEAAMAGNWRHMKKLFNSACGQVTPNEKLWLFDIDKVTDKTWELQGKLKEAGHLVSVIPSRKGQHFICKPFDIRPFVGGGAVTKLNDEGWSAWGEVSLHKDNPTNLYIPDGAA